MALLHKMRAEQMARLLATTDLSVAEAGRLVGWKDPNYASRTFHDYHGVSPTEFRRRQSTPPIG
jgi:AraC family L-rhamnose operon transcriptional activator RhaR